MAIATMPLTVAWLLTLALNLMLWGQELWLKQTPGILCLVQLGMLLPLLLLTVKALMRRIPVTGYWAVLIGTSGAAVAFLDLLFNLHPKSGSAAVVQHMPWVRSSELIGPLPTGLLALLLYTGQLYFQLLAYWEIQGADQRAHSA